MTISQKLIVSLSPHVNCKDSIQRIMFDVVIALIPAFLIALYVFGFGALRLTIVAVASCVLWEYIITRFLLKIRPSVDDGSAIVTGILLAFNLPSHLPWGMVIVGSLVAIGIGKMSFGGLGHNPFNPALVGRVFLMVSFPASMSRWPKPIVTRFSIIDAVTGATPLGIMKDGLTNHIPVFEIMNTIPNYINLFLGTIGGCIGEVSAGALILGAIYLLWRRVICWHIPVSIILTIFFLSAVLWIFNPQTMANPFFHILTGGIFLGAIFMATDMVTSPMTPKGMVIFGFGIGFITVIIRVFGAYPEGMSFAILIMNAMVPLIDKCCPPIKYGIKNHE